MAKPKVLIAEDSWAMRETLRLLLSFDFDCVTVEDGATGFARMLEAPPDLLLSDVAMSGLDGYALCGLVRAEERLKDVRVVLLSGYAPREKLPPGGALPDAYLVKPVPPPILIETLHRLLQR